MVAQEVALELAKVSPELVPGQEVRIVRAENSTRRPAPASPRRHGCITENVSDTQVRTYLVMGLPGS